MVGTMRKGRLAKAIQARPRIRKGYEFHSSDAGCLPRHGADSAPQHAVGCAETSSGGIARRTRRRTRGSRDRSGFLRSDKMDIWQPGLWPEARRVVVPLGGVAEGVIGVGLRPSQDVWSPLPTIRSDCKPGANSGDRKARQFEAQRNCRKPPALGWIANAKGTAARLLNFNRIREVSAAIDCREDAPINHIEKGCRRHGDIFGGTSHHTNFQRCLLKWLEAIGRGCENHGRSRSRMNFRGVSMAAGRTTNIEKSAPLQFQENADLIETENDTDDIAWATRSSMWQARTEKASARPTKRAKPAPALTLAGHGMSLRIEGGALTIQNGLTHYPQQRETFRFFRGDLSLPERIILLDGSVSVLDFVKTHAFDPADFVIRSDGVCRLNPEMARMVVARVWAT